MRSRGVGGAPRASTHHYHPRHLLYHRDSHWHCGTYADILRRMRGRLSPAARAGLDAIVAGDARRREATAQAFVDWVEAEGPRYGVRVPNAAERARSTGRGNYILSLGLTERGVFDLVGNHFDPDALTIRLAGPLRQWRQGDRTRHQFLHPAPLLHIFGQVRAWVISQGAPAERQPFPDDLRLALLTAGGRPRRGTTRAEPPAAEDGRGDG